MLSIVVLEKTLESPMHCKEIQPVHPKGDQSWVFIGRTDVEDETPILWPPYAKSWLIGKDLDAGKDWGQEEKGTTEDKMVGWDHRLNGHGFGCTLGGGDSQGGLVCYGSWGNKESDKTERLNWTELVAQTVNSLPTMQGAWDGSLGSEEPPGEGNGNPFQYLCLEIPRTSKPGGLQSTGLQSVRQAWATMLSLFVFYNEKWISSSLFYPSLAWFKRQWY